MMMTIKNKADFERQILTILLNSENPYQVYALCNDIVNVYGREGGTLAYTLMNEAFKRGLPDEAENAALDVLEALTGYCADPIGTADYHLTDHAA
ncbi:hypothetical protein [Pectobacterium brasiliense]|uniref:hypothetical protein n=1 Tax=Pectobacterium brasiliense TaxID=180957 RepID=UPI00057E9D7C|nr:hypothetical protein [Pectobacterium brasiliense]